jgi:eukaryotic-like serine/threonine-protein kinase
MAESDPPTFALPPDLAERDVVQAALELGLTTEIEVEEARNARAREARRDLYRPLLEHLAESRALTPAQIRRLIDLLTHQERPDEPRGYRFIEQVGSGSMGQVFKATQVCLNRIVAVKLLARQHSRNRTYVERFIREATLSGQTVSPHFARVYEAGQSRGQHYIVMEFVEGESIEAQLAAGKKYETPEVVDLAIELTFALEHLHGLSIVHRDIKPQNVVTAKDGRLKLMDLGLAHKLDDAAQTDAESGNAIGTPFYISPEQIVASDKLDPRSDLYSLGATMYHLLAGRPPFTGTDTPRVLEAHLRQPPAPLVDHDPKIPRNMERLVLKLLEKDPQNRFSSARRVRNELLTLEAQLDPAMARLKRGATNGA